MNKDKMWHEIDTKTLSLKKTIKEFETKISGINFKFDSNKCYQENLFELKKSLCELDMRKKDILCFLDKYNKNLLYFNNQKYGSKNYFESYQNERDLVVKNWETYIKSFFDYFKGKIIVVGINDGQEISNFMGNKNKVYGVDISQSALKECKKKRKDIICVKADSANIPFKDETFDSYISLRTLHVTGIKRFESIKEAYRVLKKGGHFLISIPWGSVNHKGHIVKGQYGGSKKDDFEKQKNEFIDYISKTFNNCNLNENKLEFFMWGSKNV